MHPCGRLVSAGAFGMLVLGVAGAGMLTSCSRPPTRGNLAATRSASMAAATTSSTTAATTSSTTSSTAVASNAVASNAMDDTPEPTVPDVVGLKIVAAKTALRAAGLAWVGLNAPCDKGTVASQSVVSSLGIAGPPPDPRVGTTPLIPGTTVPRGTVVAITWSACYEGDTPVPYVVGRTFAEARRALHVARLTWACYSLTTTPSRAATGGGEPSAPGGGANSTDSAGTVLNQDPGAGTVLRPGAPVRITMRTCPQ